MITVEFKTDGKKLSLHMKGHAEAAREGEDIICASASMLAYTAAQTMQFLYADGGLKRKPITEIGKGEARIEAIPADGSYAEALHTFFVVQVGFHLLAHNYPQYVELISFGESEGT